jgi:hypothetical protein
MRLCYLVSAMLSVLKIGKKHIGCLKHDDGIQKAKCSKIAGIKWNMKILYERIGTVQMPHTVLSLVGNFAWYFMEPHCPRNQERIQDLNAESLNCFENLNGKNIRLFLTIKSIKVFMFSFQRNNNNSSFVLRNVFTLCIVQWHYVFSHILIIKLIHDELYLNFILHG